MHSGDIISRIRAALPDLDQYDVASLALFGSRARGEAGPSSDIAILVEFSKPPTFASFMGLKFALEHMLGLQVDLVDRDALRPAWREALEKDAMLVA